MSTPSNIHNTTIGNKKINDLVVATDKMVDSVWDYKILTIDKNPVTIANLTIASIILILGLITLSKFKTRLKLFLSKKFSQDKDAANALENLITYFMLIIFVTIVLQIANIPLSTFAFVGGALAIGVGLGAQNLINNFMSSLIIMIERPVKIGDNIQIDNIQGRVISIGARCITIETSKMTDVLIPNSRVIQENLTNWSWIDHNIKSFIEIRFYKNILCKIGKELSGSSLSEKDYEDALTRIKKPVDRISPDEILEKLQLLFDKIPEINISEKPSIYFLGTDNFYYSFQVVIMYDSKNVGDFSSVKSNINKEICKIFDMENLVIEYIN
jgi:small-conductance mechanosensitive channel